MTNRVSGAVGFAAADLGAAIPGPPFRKTGAGLICSSEQATRTLQVNRSETATPYCRPRFMSPVPLQPQCGWRDNVGPNRVTPQGAARGEGSVRPGARGCTNGEPRHGRISLPPAPRPHRKLIRNCPIEQLLTSDKSGGQQETPDKRL
jgi:hypothetical protein